MLKKKIITIIKMKFENLNESEINNIKEDSRWRGINLLINYLFLIYILKNLLN